MRIFYDCEFLENGSTIRLISIGLVREDESEYYAIVDDIALMQDAADHPWLRDNVLTGLPVAVVDGGTASWDTDHADFKHVKSRETIAAELVQFLHVDNPQLWAWYGAYDHVALVQLWGRMVDLPGIVPMYTNDIRQELERRGRPFIPSQPSGAHNALEDARYNWFRMIYLDNLTNRGETHVQAR